MGLLQAGHAAIATLIRNTKQKGAKDVLPRACAEKIKKQQEKVKFICSRIKKKAEAESKNLSR
jgi:hypothetical protein